MKKEYEKIKIEIIKFDSDITTDLLSNVNQQNYDMLVEGLLND